MNGKSAADVYGTYMGYMDFNGLRYFDIRETAAILNDINPLMGKSLPSDSTRRIDAITLETGDSILAQTKKELLEDD